MIKYNDDNIYVGYIKQLLHSFNLPFCKVHKDTNTYFEGEYFINADTDKICQVTAVDIDGKLTDSKEICNYKLNDKYLNITHNLELRNNFYDSYTHEYLGRYLRFIKDYCKLDLMSLYNCFSSESPKNLDISLNNVRFYAKDSAYTIYMIPVVANQEYTLAVDSSQKIDIFFGHYSYNNLIVSNKEAQDQQTLGGLSFKKPIVIKTPNTYIKNQEKNFKMFIKVPITMKKSIVLLEGNYLSSCEFSYDEYGSHLKDIIFTKEAIENKVDDIYDYSCKKQLLELSSDTKYLLADRLVEYLSSNVITHLDEIVNNIKKIQIYLSCCKTDEFKFNAYGIWTKDINQWIYRFLNTNKDNRGCKFLDLYNDLLSYVDKDVESLLPRMKFTDNKELLEKAEKVLEDMGGDLNGI